MSILDTNGNPITALPLSLVENTDSATLVIRVACKANQYLAAEENSAAQVLARRHGTADFADLATDPISLTPYAETTVDFDLKIHAGSVTGIVHAAIPVRVTYNP
jgi:hypothetical protein